jgi:hypothetical protein
VDPRDLPPHPRDAPDPAAPHWVEAPHSPLKRFLAAVALAALIASGAYLSWWVLSGQAAKVPPARLAPPAADE